MDEALRLKIDALTVMPCSDGPITPATDVVFVPFPACGHTYGTLADGFARSRALLDEGRTVHLLADGATIHHAWPAWVRRERKLRLSEVGAYFPAEHAEPTQAIRAGLESWLDEIFAGAAGELRGSQVFYGSACNRIFQTLLENAAGIGHIAGMHPGARVHLVDARYPAAEMLRDAMTRVGGDVLPHAPPAAVLWRARLGVFGAAALAAALAMESREYIRGRASRARLRELRERLAFRPSPSKWIVLAPDWFRANRHTLHTVATPILEEARASSGERSAIDLGILLFIRLRSGARVETNLRESAGAELWTGLGELRGELERCGAVEQVVGAESIPDLVRSLGRGALRSARVLARMAARPAVVERGTFRANLANRLSDVVKLCTIDVLRTAVAEHATKAVLRRHSFEGRPVVFPASSFAPETTADLLLQQGGAITVDHFHGSGHCTWIGSSQSRSSVRCVWTHADAKLSSAFGQRTIVAGVPGAVAPRARPRPGLRRILVITNYAHRDTLALDGTSPLEPFQQELLDVVPRIRAAFGDRFEFRWRPHPADDDKTLERGHATIPDVPISRGVPLEQDIAWAELIVMSLSSATAEALLSNIPMFVQYTPQIMDYPIITMLPASRRFFRAAELIPKLTECVAAIDRGDPDVLAPEELWRERMFGNISYSSPLEALARPEERGRESVVSHLR